MGLWPVSGAQRRFRAKTHGSDAPAPRSWRRCCSNLRFDDAIGRDHGVIDLHPLRLALREQYLAAAQPRRQAAAGPEGATNLGLIGQYVEMPKEIAFTIECSVRSAWEAIYTLLKRGPAPPPVYQGQFDPKALFDALKVFVGL